MYMFDARSKGQPRPPSRCKAGKIELPSLELMVPSGVQWVGG